MQVDIASSAASSSSASSQGSIASLEKQREQILQKIRDLNSDKTVDAKEKAKELALYQAQLQLIEAQIEQLRAKQAEARAKAATRKGETQETQFGARQEAQASPVAGSVHVVA